jgi:prepilin-type processing-associated H-X9-DG protein
MVVEAAPSASVPWYKPVDFVPDEKDPKKDLTGLWAGGFNAAMGDGSVRFISEAIDPKVLKALFTIAGGEVAQDF